MKIKQKFTSSLLALALVSSNLVISSALTSDWNNNWAKEQIKIAMDKGWVVTTDKFRPNDSITRAEFVKVFNKVFQLTKTNNNVFSDTKNHWAKNEIDIAVTNGVCQGTSSTTFEPDAPITREQAATMISNYKNLADNDLDKLTKYKDENKVSSWAKSSVEGVIESGYMNGYTDNTFKPKNNITRAEAVVTMTRINDKNDFTPNNSFLAFQKEVLDLVNKERAKAGVSQLSLDDKLSNVATIKSQDMIDKNYFDHTSPTYGSPYEMMKQFGISYTIAGENIAAGQSTPQQVMNDWMNSSGHRGNILNSSYTKLGVGIAKDANGKLYWTQMFIG